MGAYTEANLDISSELAALLSGSSSAPEAPPLPADIDVIVNTVDVVPEEVAVDVESVIVVSTPAIAEVEFVQAPTALEHVADWWQETLASAPPLHHKGLKEHIEDSWHKLVSRLGGY